MKAKKRKPKAPVRVKRWLVVVESGPHKGKEYTVHDPLLDELSLHFPDSTVYRLVPAGHFNPENGAIDDEEHET